MRILGAVVIALAACGLTYVWQNPSGLHWIQQQSGPYLQGLPKLLSKTTTHPLGDRIPSGTKSSSSSSSSSLASQSLGTQLLTAEQLLQFRGKGGKPMYLSILGDIFDVSSKPEFYGDEGGYQNMTGRDATRSFHTGDFIGDITDEVSDFDAEACHGLVHWRDFYFETYPHIGKLTGGAFYDAQGQPTTALRQVEVKAEEGKKIKAAKKDEEFKFPSCNSKWTEAEGATVWCDQGMHPRYTLYKQDGEEMLYRCGCFEDVGWSDYRQLYPECDPEATVCKILQQTSGASS